MVAQRSYLDPHSNWHSHADANSATDANAHSYPDSTAHAHSIAYRNPCVNTPSHSYTHVDSYPGGHSSTDANSTTQSHANSATDANAHSYPDSTAHAITYRNPCVNTPSHSYTHVDSYPGGHCSTDADGSRVRRCCRTSS